MGSPESAAVGPTDPVRITARRPGPGSTGPARLLPGPVVFVDGECHVCERTVDALMARDPSGVLRFASLQGETAAALAAEVSGLPLDLGSAAVAEPDARTGTVRLTVGSDALVRALELTGSLPRWVGLARRVPRPVRDALYRVVIRARYRFSGRKDSCRLPTVEERGRLLP